VGRQFLSDKPFRVARAPSPADRGIAKISSALEFLPEMRKHPLGAFRLCSGGSRQSSDFLLEFSISNERREPAIAAEFAPVLRIANTSEDYLPHTLFLILIQWCPSEALKRSSLIYPDLKKKGSTSRYTTADSIAPSSCSASRRIPSIIPLVQFANLFRVVLNELFFGHSG